MLNIIKKSSFLVAGLMVACGHLAADSTLWIGSNWRQDSLKWSIGIPEGGPDILSELEWKDVQMVQISAGIFGDLCQDWYYRLKGNYGKIYDGKNRDSDYFGNHRTNLLFQSNNAADKGEAFDFSIGLGYPLQCGGKQFKVIPMMGYSRSEQHLYMRKGYLTVDEIFHMTGPFEGLNSRYETKWSSFWLGLDFLYEMSCDLSFYGSCEYHLAFYRASGHWNLRADIRNPFHHDANGDGLEVFLGANYHICSGIGIGAELGYKYYQTENGTDKTSLIGDDEVCVGRLNPVDWRSFYVGGTIFYVF